MDHRFTLCNSADSNTSASVVRFPVEKAIRSLSNDPKMEFLFTCLDGHLNPAKKHIILLARSPEVAFIDDQTAQILISALGLGPA